MNKSILKFSLFGLLAIALAGIPAVLCAQTATNTNASAKKYLNHPYTFRGYLMAIDTQAKTISLTNETIQITSETTIMKAGKPATLEDGVVGDEVAGSYHKDADGKLNATFLRFAPKLPTDANTKTNKP
jgi:hypothetical protein